MTKPKSDADSQPEGLQIQARKEAIPNLLLRIARHRRGWTQQALADQLGTTPLAINRWEQGKAAPSAYFRTKLCDVFGFTEAELGLVPLESLAPLERFWSVPHRQNPFFTGRQTLLEDLYSHLRQEKTATSPQTIALSGLGGIGKTQIALEYTYRYVREYRAVFWITADTLESIITGFSAIAECLKLPEKQESDQNKMVAAVSRWLVDQRGWLLILDNVEDLKLIQRFLPPAPHGALLLTMRAQALGALARPMEVKGMTLEEAIKLLLCRSRREASRTDHQTFVDETRARAVAELMDGFPLALDQAGAYIEETQCGFDEYLQMYQSTPLALLDERDERSSHPISVVKTLTFAFEKVQFCNPAAADLLRLCSFLAPNAIPEVLITRGTSHIGAEFQQIAGDLRKYHAALKVLLSYSLLQRHPETKTLTLHRLVQVVIREQLAAEEQWRWTKCLVQVCLQEIPYEIMQTSRWSWYEQLLPHILTIITWAGRYERLTREVAALQFTVAVYLRDRGRYAEGEQLFTKAIQIQEETAGQDSLPLACSLKELGVLSIRWGKFEQAEEVLQRSLQLYEQQLGSDHLDAALVLYTLAMLYGNWKRDEQAEPLLKRALHLYEQQLGPEHQHVIKTLIALGLLASKEQARYHEAEELFTQALTTGERVLGEQHYLVVTALNNLGNLYTYQERYEEAEPLLERALRTWEQELGPEHPYTADPLAGLAEVYKGKGAYEEAERCYLQSLRIREQTLGPEHPLVALSAYSLADLYRKWDKRKNIEHLYRQALLIQVRQLGKDHRETVRTLNDYRVFLEEDGREEEITCLLIQIDMIQTD